MSVIIEEILKLPREEKIELLHALQQDLKQEHEDTDEDGLHDEEMFDAKNEEKLLATAELEWLPKQDFEENLNAFKSQLAAMRNENPS